MLQNLSYPGQAPALVNHTDSVNFQLRMMQIKIDSLSKHTQINEIGQNFFSDAISRDLYMFSTMIVIVGLVSWGFIAGVLARHKRTVLKSTNRIVKSYSKDLEKKFDELKSDFLGTEYNVNRAMYFTCDGSSAKIKFGWALSTLISLFKSDPENEAAIDVWISFLEDHVHELEEGQPEIVKNIDRYIEEINKIIPTNNDNFANKLKEVKRHLLHVAHTIPKPPEDLMEGDGKQL